MNETILKTRNLCGLEGASFRILLDLVPFVQFEKREKYQWRSVTY